MGKRKRSLSSESKGGANAPAPNDQTVSHPATEKKLSGSSMKFWRITTSQCHQQHFHPLDEEQDDDYDVWLVRKPTEVPLEQITHIKFPKKARSSSKLIEISDCQENSLGATYQLECRFERPRSQMFHIHTRMANNAKHLRNLKPCAKIKGVMWINHMEKLIDKFPVLPDEDFLNANRLPDQHNTDDSMNSSSSFMPFSIDPIRRKPELDLEDLKERLKVFGGNQPSTSKRKRKKTEK
uniref:Uncharacterized protein n=1 Tax=Ditylenchus dipsaci TaxID=166011 RepID=A0A915DS57_9BILA